MILTIPPAHIIFIHIPKTGGRTIQSIVARQYPRDEILVIDGPLGGLRQRLPDDTARSRFIIGVVPYGIHTELPGTSTYLTLLREPVDRVVSLFRYIVRNPRHQLHDEVTRRGLREFVSGDLDREEVENAQTKQIAGLAEGVPDASSLISAKGNLTESFAAVGLVERFDESILLFRKRLGWKMPFYVPKNVGKARSRADVGNDALEIIRDRNRLDIELYDFARHRFDDQLRRGGPLFASQVAGFQLLNAVAGLYRDGRDQLRGARHT